MTQGPKSSWKEKAHAAGTRVPRRKEVLTGALKNDDGRCKHTPSGRWAEEQRRQATARSPSGEVQDEGRLREEDCSLGPSTETISVTEIQNWNDKKLHHPEIKGFQQCGEFLFQYLCICIYQKLLKEEKLHRGKLKKTQLNKWRWKIGERRGPREAPNMVAGRMGSLLTAKGTADLSRCKHSAENNRAG